MRQRGRFMEIVYSDNREFSEEELGRLFLAVGWSSGNYPQRLKRALGSYAAVYCAREGEKLIGLAAAMDDGEMTAYMHYLLVDPEYQGRGIGRKLLGMVKSHYADYLKIVIVASPGKEGFYSSEGFSVAKGTPMYLTDMED